MKSGGAIGSINAALKASGWENFDRAKYLEDASGPLVGVCVGKGKNMVCKSAPSATEAQASARVAHERLNKKLSGK